MDALHLDRSQLYRYQEMDRSKYNLVIGGMLVYGFFVDALICYFFGDILNYVLDSGPVMIGFFVTNIVCVILSVVLSSSPNAVVKVELVLFLLGFGTEFTDYIVIAIFSLYLGFDWQRANRVTPSIRNAILSATQIYLDIVNIFIRLLRILARSRKN